MHPSIALLQELGWVPSPLGGPCEWAVAKALVNNPELQANIPETSVPVDQIKPTQYRLDIDKVASMARDGHTDGALVFKRDGQHYLWDGHHRFAACQQLKKTDMKCKVFTLPDTSKESRLEGLSLEDFAGQLKQDPKAIIQAMDSHERSHYEGSVNEATPAGISAQINQVEKDINRLNESADKINKTGKVSDAEVKRSEAEAGRIAALLKRLKG